MSALSLSPQTGESFGVHNGRHFHWGRGPRPCRLILIACLQSAGAGPQESALYMDIGRLLPQCSGSFH